MNFNLGDVNQIFWGGATAIIIYKKNIGKKRKIKRMREYFADIYGIFKVDSDMEYRHTKQPLFWYNSHGTNLSKKAVKKIYSLWHRKKEAELLAYLQEEFPFLKENIQKDVFDAFEQIVEKDQHYPIDLDTEKFLPHFLACSPISLKMLPDFSHKGIRAVESLYPKAKIPIPIVAVMIGVVIFVIIFQSLPDYFRQIQNAIGGLIPGS